MEKLRQRWGATGIVLRSHVSILLVLRGSWGPHKYEQFSSIALLKNLSEKQKGGMSWQKLELSFSEGKRRREISARMDEKVDIRIELVIRC